MYIINITDDYNDTLSLTKNCTNSEKNIEIVIPLIAIISCGMSIICLISVMAYILVKPLFNKKNSWIYTNIRVLIPGYNYTLRVLTLMYKYTNLLNKCICQL